MYYNSSSLKIEKNMTLQSEIIQAIKKDYTDRKTGRVIPGAKSDRFQILAGILENRCGVNIAENDFETSAIVEKCFVNDAARVVAQLRDKGFIVTDNDEEAIEIVTDNDEEAIEAQIQDIYEMHERYPYSKKSKNFPNIENAFYGLRLESGHQLRECEEIDILGTRSGKFGKKPQNFLENKIKSAIALQTKESQILLNVDNLITWGRNERIAKDTLHIIERLKSNSVALTLQDYENIERQVRDVYENPAAYCDAANDNKFLKLYTDFYHLTLSNGRLLGSYDGVDVFALNNGLLGETPEDFLQNKIKDSIKQTLQFAFFEEMCIQHDYELVSTTGEEVLYRGIPSKMGSTNQDYKDPWTPTGIAHCPPNSFFSTSIKSDWHPYGNNSNATATTFFLPIALRYAFPKEDGLYGIDGKLHNYSKKFGSKVPFPAREAKIYVIRPPHGQEGISLTHYNAFGSNFREFTLPGVPSEWIEKIVTIKQTGDVDYEVVGVDPNKHFYGYLRNNNGKARGGTGEKLKPADKKNTFASAPLVEDLLSPGVKIKSKTSLIKTVNNHTTPIFNHFGKGKRIRKRYEITVPGKAGVYVYRGGKEQKRLFKEHYNHSPSEHTSLRHGRYKDQVDFKKKYTEDKKAVVRQNRDAAHPCAQDLLKAEIENLKTGKKNHTENKKPAILDSSKTSNKTISSNKMSGKIIAKPKFQPPSEPIASYVENYLWENVRSSLTSAQIADKFPEAKAIIKHLSVEYYFNPEATSAEVKIMVTNFLTQGKIALSSEQAISLYRIIDLDILQKSRDILINKVITHNKDADLSHGIYGGLGGKGSIVFNDKGNPSGFRIDEIFAGGSFAKIAGKGMEVGAIITEIDGHNIAREGLNTEQVISLLRGIPGQNTTITFASKDGTLKTETLQRQFIDATTQTVYSPLAKQQKKEEVAENLINKFSTTDPNLAADIRKIIHTKSNPESSHGLNSERYTAVQNILRKEMLNNHAHLRQQ